MKTFRLAIVAAVLTGHAVAGLPTVNSGGYDPLDVTNPILFVKEDPLVSPANPQQKKIVVGTRPFWYIDGLGRIQAIQTTITQAVVGDELHHAAVQNTVAFIEEPDGSCTYSVGPRSLSLKPGRLALISSIGAILSDAAAHVPTARTLPRENALVQHGVFPGIEIRYEVAPGAVKETITLLAKPEAVGGATRFLLQWDYSSSGLTPKLNNGRIEWSPSDLSDPSGAQPLLVLPAPAIRDARGFPGNCWYELDALTNAIRLGYDAAWLYGAVFPVEIDPTVTTVQADCTANSAVKDEIEEYIDDFKDFYVKIALPDLTGFQSIDSALFKAYRSGGDATNLTGVSVYCDVTGAWNESSPYTTLRNLSFNGATASNVTITAVSEWKPFDILGDLTKGIRKIYNDDPSPSPCTVCLSYTGRTGALANHTNSVYLGQEQTNVHYFGSRSQVEFYPRIEIIYSSEEPARTPVQASPTGVLVY